jgi:FtsZ-binding cell division protein ZapB
MTKFVELCRVGERNLDEIHKKKHSSITEEQEIKGKTQKLRMKITQLQEQNMAFSMQWEKRKTSLLQSIEETNR